MRSAERGGDRRTPVRPPARTLVRLAAAIALAGLLALVLVRVPAWLSPAAASEAAEESRGRAFEPLAPSIVLSKSDWRRLDDDQPIVRTLHGENGQLAVFVATRLDARPDALATWTRAIAQLKESRFVLAVGRFSDPPAVRDVDGLSLDDKDLNAIRDCSPDDCDLKLSAADIRSLRQAVAASGDDWRDAVQREFRRRLVARVDAYRAGGLRALPPPAGNGAEYPPDRVFADVLAASPFLQRMPRLEAWLRGYPQIREPRIESFFYWSREHYGGGKPVVSVTHVGIVRQDASSGLPPVLVAGKQIFATHYFDGGLGLTMVLQDPAGGRTYLAYLNRSQVDLLRGFFGGLARRIVEGRVERQAPEIVRGLRRRLESDGPVDDPLR